MLTPPTAGVTEIAVALVNFRTTLGWAAATNAEPGSSTCRLATEPVPLFAVPTLLTTAEAAASPSGRLSIRCIAPAASVTGCNRKRSFGSRVASPVSVKPRSAAAVAGTGAPPWLDCRVQAEAAVS